MTNDAEKPTLSINRLPHEEKEESSWNTVSEYVKQQAQGKEEFWLPDYYELIDDKGESMRDSETKRIFVELGLMKVGEENIPMLRMPIRTGRARKGGGRSKAHEAYVIRPVNALGDLLQGRIPSGVRRLQQLQVAKTGSVTDPHSVEKAERRVTLSEIERTQRKVIAFLLDRGNTVSTIHQILHTGKFGPKLPRGEILSIIHEAKDLKAFVAQQSGGEIVSDFGLLPIAIRELMEIAAKIQSYKWIGLNEEELMQEVSPRRAARERIPLDIEKHDTRWREQILLMAAHFSAAKVPHDITVKIINSKLNEEGRGPLTYSDLGQVYNRVFFRDPHNFIQSRDTHGVGLSNELQAYVDAAIREYDASQSAERERRIAEDMVRKGGGFAYDVAALQKLAQKDQELLLAWNDGRSSAHELINRFGLRPGTLGLKVAALRTAGFPVREGSAMKTLAELVTVDSSIHTEPKPELYNYDPERLRDLPEAAQWIVKVWNRGEYTLYRLGKAAGVNPGNLQNYLWQLRQRQYPVRVGEGAGPLAGMRPSPGGAHTQRPIFRGTSTLDPSLTALLQHPILPREEQLELIRQWQQQNDQNARDRLVRHTYRLVAKVAFRYRSYGLDMSELMSLGVTGVLQAIDRMDVTKNTSFATFAAWWIRARIARGIQDQGSTIRIPAYLQTGARRADEAPISVIGIEDMTAGSDGRERAQDTVPELADESMLSERAAVDAKEITEGWEDVLNDRELDIATRHFFGDETLEEIGKDAKYNLSRERIRQIEESALEKLRTFLGIVLKEKRDLRAEREVTLQRFVARCRAIPDERWRGVLNERELDILTQRFLQNKTRAQVAQETGTPLPNVGGIESQGIGKLRQYFAYLDEINER